MKNHYLNYSFPKTYSLLVFFTLVSILSACNSSDAPTNTPAPSSEKKESVQNIVVTTGMIKDAVENIVKDKAQVTALMGTGVDPHLYKATQSDLTKLTNADIIFYNGLHLEGKMQEILEKLARNKPVIAISEAVKIDSLIALSAEEQAQGNTYDPHIWFDIRLWMSVVGYIGQSMQSLDAGNAPFYKQNADRYLGELGKLHHILKKQLATIPKEQRVLVTSHDAFGYFGRAYEVEVKGLQGISTITEFGLKDVSNMVKRLTEEKIKAVFVESSVAQKPLQAVVEGCKAKGHDINIGGTLFSDAMGKTGTPEGTYVGMMNHNVQTILKALK